MKPENIKIRIDTVWTPDGYSQVTSLTYSRNSVKMSARVPYVMTSLQEAERHLSK